LLGNRAAFGRYESRPAGEFDNWLWAATAASPR